MKAFDYYKNLSNNRIAVKVQVITASTNRTPILHKPWKAI